MGGVGDGIGGSKVVSAVADGGRCMSVDEVPICLISGYSDSLEEGRAYGGEVRDLPLLARVGMESRWEARNMVADLWGSGSSGTEGANIVMPARPPSRSARIR